MSKKTGTTLTTILKPGDKLKRGQWTGEVSSIYITIRVKSEGSITYSELEQEDAELMLVKKGDQ